MVGAAVVGAAVVSAVVVGAAVDSSFFSVGKGSCLSHTFHSFFVKEIDAIASHLPQLTV